MAGFYKWTTHSDSTVVLMDLSFELKTYSDEKKRWVTKPKRNADFRAKPKGLCIFTKSLNLMDLALDKKEKAKQ